MEIGDRMQLKEIINNKYTSTNVRWGRIKNRTLSTELDSSTIIISDSPKLDIEAYDLVELINENGDYEYWLVADKQEEYITFNAPFKYQYTIQLMSPTKLLESIFLPNLTITNIGQNRTINFYILQIINRYFQNQYGLSFNMSTELSNKTLNVVTKEYTFSEPTLREYLDWLLSLVGAIITLKVRKTNNIYYFVFDYLDLSGNDTEIDSSYITDIYTGQDSDSYVSRILHTSDDIISEQPIKEFLKEATNDPILNSDNAKILLTRKTYDIQALRMLNVSFRVRLSITSTTGMDEDGIVYSGTMTVDISDFLKTADEYSTLTIPHPDSYYTTGYGPQPKAFYSVTPDFYLTNTITWDRGNNAITNLHYMQNWEKLWFDYNAGISIENLLRRKIWKYYQSIAEPGDFAKNWPDGRLELKMDDGYGFVIWYMYYVDVDYDYADQMFEIEYQPYFSPKIVEASNRNNIIYSIDTNTNAKTDILTHLDRSKEKLSQLACDFKIMSAVSKIENNDYSPKIELGQAWYDENNNKFILTKLETVVFNSHIQYKGTLSFNYSNNIIDTTLNREKRYFAYANTNIVNRKENYVRTFKVEVGNLPGGAANYPLIPADYCKASFSYGDEIGYYLLPIVPIYNDRMISFELDTMDNIGITEIKGDSITGGYQNEVLKYVNDNGEFSAVNVKLGMLNYLSSTQVLGKTPIEWASQFDISTCKEEVIIDDETEIVDRSDELMYSTMTNIPIYLLKDNREQFSLTLQYILKVSNSGNENVLRFNLKNYLLAIKEYYKNADLDNDEPFEYWVWFDVFDIRSGYTSIRGLFNTDFLGNIPHSDNDNVSLRVMGTNLPSNDNIVLEVGNYKGGYITASYEDFK